MDKYLLEILKTVKTIIIPGLGAMTVVNEATGEIMFMPYLKYDDSSLTNYIAERESMSVNDAKNLIAKYVREVEAKLNSGDSYDMYQFGTFTKNSSGDIEFTSWDSEKDATKVESQSPEPIKIEVESATTEEVPVNEYVPEPTVTKPKIQTPDHEVTTVEVETTNEVEELVNEPQNSQEEEKSVIPDEKEEITKSETNILVDTVVENEYVPEVPAEKIEQKTQYTEEQQWADDLDLPPVGAKIERPKKPILEKTSKDKKRKGPVFYVLLTLGVLIIGGTLTLGIFYNSFERFIHSGSKELAKTEETQSEETTKTEEEPEEIGNDTTTTEVPTEEIKTEDIAPILPEEETSGMIQTSTGSVNPSQPFHVIAGAFQKKTNAERFRDRLRENGNSNSEIIGQFDGLFIVSASSHSSMEEAQDSRKSNTTISKSWIFRWP